MKRRMLNYLKKMEETNFENLSEEERGKMARRILVQIEFFQHERFIHLIVTVTFAILLLMSILVGFFQMNVTVLLLDTLFFVLLVPYIKHYYLLENGVQKLYCYYDACIDDTIV